MKTFAVGDSVVWMCALSKGKRELRYGVIEVELQPGDIPDEKVYPYLAKYRKRIPRADVSYIVRTRLGGEGVFWPMTVLLNKSSKKVVLTRRLPRQICASMSSHDPPYFCTKAFGHEGPHVAHIDDYPLMQWRDR